MPGKFDLVFHSSFLQMFNSKSILETSSYAAKPTHLYELSSAQDPN